MSESEIPNLDKILKIAQDGINNLEETVSSIGEKLVDNPNSRNKHSIKLYHNFCKRGDCPEIDYVNSLIKYLEDSLSVTNDENIKIKIRNAIKQIKDSVGIKY